MPPLHPIRQFGQHFLTDTGTADQIIEASEIQAGEPVWEIGPGKGILTGRILKFTNDLTAFEIDTRLSNFLQQQFGRAVQILNRDVLACDWEAMLAAKEAASGRKVKLVSNLPYQITSPVLYALEENARWFSRAVLMLQKEVAERLAARAGCKAYGVLTLRIRYYFDLKLLFNVPPESFDPIPKVSSSVVVLTPRSDPPALKSLDTYRMIIKKAFIHRRKTLKNNLRCLYSEKQLERLERESGIDFRRRGETIEEGEFAHLADCAYELPGPQPDRS